MDILENSGDPLPYLTADLPGVAGLIKQQATDFQVEEIPAYLPTGEGEHLFLWIEKTGLSAEQLTKHIVQSLRMSKLDLGVAAMKDRHAVTRQFVSVPAKFAPLIDSINSDHVKVLSAVQHQNKLKTGHLRGNRFSILMRNVAPDALDLAQKIADRLMVLGTPNYYGDQRFGTDGETATMGLELLRGEQTAEDIHPARRRFLLRFALSSAQSVLFNHALADRLNAGLLHKVQVGDVMQVTASGGIFVCDDATTDQARFDAQEICITGPMFGRKMKQPGAEIAAREATVLNAYQLQESDFDRYPQLTSGTRRAVLIYPKDMQITEEAEGLRFNFSLPAGCYATVVLREFQKSQTAETAVDTSQEDSAETDTPSPD